MTYQTFLSTVVLVLAADFASAATASLDVPPNSCVISCPEEAAYAGLTLGVTCSAGHMPKCQCETEELPGAGCVPISSETSRESGNIGSVEGLQSQAASLFDLGMQRLPPNISMFDGFYRSGSNNRQASLDLNWWFEKDAGQIVGSLGVWDATSDHAAMEAGCQEVLVQLSRWVNKSLPKIFMHHGWDWDDYSDDMKPLDTELREMFDLTCIVYGHSTNNVRFRARKTLHGDMVLE
jgi:hypothetical protein